MEHTQKLSQLSETLVGSEIVRMNGEIRQLMKSGERIFNFTIGDFDTAAFPIPHDLEEEIVFAYRQHLTNYPAGEGEEDLRRSVSRFIAERQGLDYTPEEVLVASGGRPLIYSFYRAVADKGDKVVYSVPSWNNNHYVHFVQGRHAVVPTSQENGFMPTAADLRPHLKGAVVLALCSPQNPTGTVFSRAQLQEICDMVVEENARRKSGQKKLYLLFDQIYWQLTFGKTAHVDPVGLRRELRPYTVYVDGISKAFAATGVRVGWALGPVDILGRMKAILSHVGAWSPMPEQKATAKFLMQKGSVDQYLKILREGIHERMRKIHQQLSKLAQEGYPIEVIAPQAAIYLSVKIDLKGRTTGDGKVLHTQADVTEFLLRQAGLALVPFSVFGTEPELPWYRLCVGTVRTEEIADMAKQLRLALKKLK